MRQKKKQTISSEECAEGLERAYDVPSSCWLLHHHSPCTAHRSGPPNGRSCMGKSHVRTYPKRAQGRAVFATRKSGSTTVRNSAHPFPRTSYNLPARPPLSSRRLHQRPTHTPLHTTDSPPPQSPTTTTTRAHTRVHTRARTHARTHTHDHTNTHSPHKHAHAHTHKHTHAHTHTRTHLPLSLDGHPCLVPDPLAHPACQAHAQPGSD
jgi:hypothetical protein